MSTALCPRCLRPSLRHLASITETTLPQRAAFSTTPLLNAQPTKKKGTVVASPRQGSTLRLGKSKRATNARPPASGERKALRKRVVLSNTNALEVPGLQDLDTQNLSVHKLNELEGKVIGFQDATVDTLRALHAFKPVQGWNLFRRPASLVRKETVSLAEALGSVTEGRTVRRVLFGERGSGKSVLLLQALALASLKGWIVVHIPEAQDLTIAHSSYQPTSSTDGQTRYIQPHYTASLLENVLNANRQLLQTLKISGQHEVPMQVTPKTTLAQLVETGAKDPERAWPVWQAFWKELNTFSHQGEGLSRPPVMFTLDGMDHIMRNSAYLNADGEPIHAHDLALVRHFVQLLSGQETLSNGGIILGAVSESNRATSPTLDDALARNAAIGNKQEPPEWDPYMKYDKYVKDALEGVEAQQLAGLSKQEARGVMEYYAQSGMLRTAVTDNFVSEKWTMSGGGIIGEIERVSVKTRF